MLPGHQQPEPEQAKPDKYEELAHRRLRGSQKPLAPLYAIPEPGARARWCVERGGGNHAVSRRWGDADDSAGREVQQPAAWSGWFVPA